MALLLVLGAMTKQRHGSSLRQMLEKSQREFLAVIFYSFVPAIDPARLSQFIQITTAIFLPGNLARQNCVSQFFTGTEVRHPDIETIAGQAAPPPAGRQNPQSILPWLDFSVNRLGFEHPVRGF